MKEKFLEQWRKKSVLKNSNGIEVTLHHYGGTITGITLPNKKKGDGVSRNIVLAYDDQDRYKLNRHYLGCLIGRYANRIGDARFALSGKTFCLSANEKTNQLHGGYEGFNSLLWDAISEQPQAVTLHHLSPDGSEGFPGNLDVYVTISLNESNELLFHYQAETDRDTVINLTHHSYFNLQDNGKSSIDEHYLHIPASFFLPINNESIPTGAIRPVADTPMDFRSPQMIGKMLDFSYNQITIASGFDHTWILDQGREQMTHAASLKNELTGISIEVYTTEPGLQFYSGNYLDDTVIGEGNVPFQKRSGLCLETQHFPDSPNHPHFPSTILGKNSPFESKTMYRFIINEQI